MTTASTFIVNPADPAGTILINLIILNEIRSRENAVGFLWLHETQTLRRHGVNDGDG